MPSRTLAVFGAIRYSHVTIPLSKRVQRIKPSPTLAVTARAARLKAEGKDIIGLGAGEPDFDTPVHIADAGVAAIRSGHTRYTSVEGTNELKDAIIGKFRRDNALEYKRSQVLVSSGAKQTVFNLCCALLDPGDEAIIPAPYWVSYPDMVLVADGTPVHIHAGIGKGFKITAAELEAAITPRTKLFILNSPSNPTGAAYSRAELEAFGAVLAKHPRVVIGTDDMYEHIWWGPEPFTSFATANPGLYGRTVTINGCSKSYAMTGWRIGYCGGTRRGHCRDGHDPGPEHVQRLLDLAEGRDRGPECVAGLRGGDEPRVQGAARLRRRGTQCASGRRMHSRLGHFLRIRECRAGDEDRGMPGRQCVRGIPDQRGRCRRRAGIRIRRARAYPPVVRGGDRHVEGRAFPHGARAVRSKGQEARLNGVEVPAGLLTWAPPWPTIPRPEIPLPR